MIVNPSYIYMGKEEPANPIITDLGTINYPYTTDNVNVKPTSSGIVLGGTITFSELPFNQFVNVDITLQAAWKYGCDVTVGMMIDGVESNTQKYTLYAGQSDTTFHYQIPEAYRKKNATFFAKCKQGVGYPNLRKTVMT